MHNRHISLVLAPAAIVLVLVVATAAVMLWDAPSGGATGTTFAPEFNVAVADTTPEATSDITFQLDLPNGDVNFAAVVGFIPGDWGVVDGRDVPVGAEVGLVQAQVTLGLINGACQSALPIVFEMLNASLDQGDTVSFDDDDGNFIKDFAEDGDGNGLIDGIDHWPDFIFRVLGETGNEPIRRSAGMTILAGIPVLLQFVTFPPGTSINENIPNDSALGYPTVVLLQNLGDPLMNPEPAPITDFCTPLASTMTFFGMTKDNTVTVSVDEGGIPLLVNPLDGSYTFSVASNGQRDADGDGYENSLDTCPLESNVGNPHIGNDGDLDSDGLDAACDPNDDPLTGGTDSDEDADGYPNRQDNCPLDPNGENESNQADADLDQIGDVCDPNPGSADTEGELSLDESNFEITIGSGAGPGGPSDCPSPGCWSPPTPVVWGDNNCSGEANPVDSLLTLRFDVGLSANTGSCPEMGVIVDVQNASPHPWGDVDCGGEVTPVDSLKLLRFDAGFDVAQEQECPGIGTSVTIVEG